ncbi:nucleoside triphosphate pyrophosphohydrolase [uncultured Intestinimonas sp.]|uniref:nucleoside triphosphate pyrophosphohydrolase n=1 Tax=uncultured Intestinimonas sp. TaxID=1689265 RepID=UPI0025FA58CB|nr:nucleoside triphosphate pyrophosphohydrolase [uncultured Intestinimonas sp.]
MIDFEQKPSYDVSDLVEIVRILRAPGGCPWDREQDHKSIRRDLLEEAYEVAEAIDEESPEHLKEELGDLLLQVVMHARMEEEEGRTDLNGVADGICKKLIYRHPHVFGDVTVTGTGEVLANWDELKKKEKHQETAADSVDAVARSLPGLWRAEKIQKKAAKVGFDWDSVDGAMAKLREETEELQTAIAEGSNVSEELGDLLFAAVNVARFVKADPETAMTAACDKFARRFRAVEEAARAQGKDLTSMTLAEMDALWDAVKQQEA